ncbi:MAG TPA: CRTAC1 family protein [Bryobacteraceae bacterium]|nr:CRTAC1 family protein [Bryobacteraceae bacterium]
MMRSVLQLAAWTGAAGILVAGLASAADEPASTIRFEDATAASGIHFTHSFGARKLGSLLESTGSGCAWFDYNNDGLPDLYVASGKPLGGDIHPYPLRQPPEIPPHNHLYRNDGNGKFTDVTDQAGVGADLFSTAVIAADYDNDGYVDLLVTGYGHVTLYRNKGDGTFEDVTAKAGLNVPGWSIGSAWLDYDRDGCVDVFIGRYVKFDPQYRAYYAADNYPGPLDYAGTTNMLFHNNCNGTFTDVSGKSGIAQHVGRTMGATAGDFDGDGYPDIYVANDKTENFLFHNNRNGTFTEMAVQSGVAYGQDGESTSAMGPVFVDFENSGHMGLWVTDSRYNRLMRNGGQDFTDATEAAGISQLTAQYVSWGSGFYDFDNDGLRDIFIAHGGLIHMVPQEHSVFRNLGGGRFADAASGAGPFFEVKTVARGACFADYDNDGKVDLFMVNLGAPGILLHNVSPGANHWLAFKLAGKQTNRDGIGAKIELAAGGRKQEAQRIAGSGYLSQDDGRVHFGLGAATKADLVTITWPSGKVQTLRDVAADRVVTVEEK